MSSGLAWGGPVALAFLTYATYLELKWAKGTLILASLCSLTLVFWMLRHNTVCEICMLAHIGVLSAALSLLPKPRFLAPLLFSLAIAFSATGGWDRFTVEHGVAIFRQRDGEIIPEGKVYVLFTDPECTRCRMVEDQISKNPQPLNILYRWTLLPHDMYRSLRAVALLEMARRSGGDTFGRLRQQIQKTSPPLTDSVLIRAAEQAGLGKTVRVWLEAPFERALIAIEGDQTTSKELNIQTLPALAELSPPDETGTRMLRLIPFSAIGVQP